jgi:hypothetical protein
MIRRLAMITLGAALFACLLCIDDVGPSGSGLFATANAVIGRPLTPMSYAGVARRTTRRAAYAGAAYAAPYAAYPPAYPPPCQPVYDAYGRLVRPC